MNTAIVVWVLMVYTHGASWVPTLEFSSQAKCEAAAMIIKEQSAQRTSWASVNSPKGWCVKIEK